MASQDNATDVALSLAMAGRYRPAAEILRDAFSVQAKAWAKVNGDPLPWSSKAVFQSFLMAMQNAKEPAKGWPASKCMALYLLSELVPPVEAPVTLEMAVTA